MLIIEQARTTISKEDHVLFALFGHDSSPMSPQPYNMKEARKADRQEREMAVVAVFQG
jgi:hypothetical protein